MKRFSKVLIGLGIITCLVGCGATSKSDDSTLKVVATANPHAIILEEVKLLLKDKYNITLEVSVVDDYYIPNKSVSDGDADANYFQHVPFFDDEKEKNGYKISNVAGIHIEPFGFYSKTLKNINDLKDGATIIISNSVADNGRILSILEKAGILTLKSGANPISATLNDIDSNPKNIVFKEVKPELLVTAYEQEEGDLVAINGNYAIQAGLQPSKDAVLLEQADQTNPYVNIVACQEGHENDEKIKALVEVLQSEEIKAFIKSTWSDGSVTPAN